MTDILKKGKTPIIALGCLFLCIIACILVSIGGLGLNSNSAPDSPEKTIARINTER